MDRDELEERLLNPEESRIQTHNVSIRSALGGPDRGRAWLVAFACCWVTLVTYGFFMAGGVFFVAFKDTFHTTREQASWPLTLLFASLSLSAPAVAVLCKYLSLRLVSTMGSVVSVLAVVLCYFSNDILLVSLLFGILQGIGYSLLTNPAFLIVNLYFKRLRVTANGIQQAGGSLGCFVFPPVINAIVIKFGLHTCFLFMAVILFTSVFATAFFTPPRWMECDAYASQNQSRNSDRYAPMTCRAEGNCSTEKTEFEENSDCDTLGIRNANCEPGSTAEIPCARYSEAKWKIVLVLLSHPMFWLIQMVYVCLGVGLPMYGQIFVDYAIDRGISKTTASYVVSASSVLDLVGRLGTGWITDYGYLSRKSLVQLMCLLIGTFCFVIPFIPNVYAFVTLSVALSLAGGTLVALIHVILAEYLGLKNLVMTIALAQFVSGVLTLLTPNVIGYFRDTVGSYQGLLFLVGSLGLVTTCTWLLEPVILRKWPKLSSEDQSVSSTPYGTASET